MGQLWTKGRGNTSLDFVKEPAELALFAAPLFPEGPDSGKAGLPDLADLLVPLS